MLERWFTPDYAQSHPEVLAWVGSILRATPATGYAACCGVIERLDLRGELTRISAPTLVLAAPEDHAIPPEHSRVIAAGVAGARLELLSGGAHLAAIERADEVAALIEGHLQQVPA